MDFLYAIPKTALRRDDGPLPGAGIVIHSVPELRMIYANRLRRQLLDVESIGSLDELEEVLKVVEPRIILLELSLVFPLAARRILRRVRSTHEDIHFATVGDAGDRGLDRRVSAGIRFHISPATTRVGAVSDLVRDLIS